MLCDGEKETVMFLLTATASIALASSVPDKDFQSLPSFTMSFDLDPIVEQIECGKTQEEITKVREQQKKTASSIGQLLAKKNNSTITLLESRTLLVLETYLAAGDLTVAIIGHGEYFCQHPNERPPETENPTEGNSS